MSNDWDIEHIEDLDSAIEFNVADQERCREKIDSYRVQLRSLKRWHQCLLAEKKQREST